MVFETGLSASEGVCRASVRGPWVSCDRQCGCEQTPEHHSLGSNPTSTVGKLCHFGQVI